MKDNAGNVTGKMPKKWRLWTGWGCTIGGLLGMMICGAMIASKSKKAKAMKLNPLNSLNPMAPIGSNPVDTV